MTIQFKCSCGKTLEVDEALAGKNVRCPACNATVLASGQSQPAEQPVEDPVEQMKTKIGEGLKEDPTRTKILIVLACWQGTLLAAMFVGALGMPKATLPMWLAMWVPLVAFIEYCIYANLKGTATSRLLLLASMVAGAAVSWTYLLMAVGDLTQSPICAAITFICSFLNVLACAGGVWYFGRPLLPTSPAGDNDEETDTPQNKDGE